MGPTLDAFVDIATMIAAVATFLVAVEALKIWKKEVDYSRVNDFKSDTYKALFDSSELFYLALSRKVQSLNEIPTEYGDLDKHKTEIVEAYYYPKIALKDHENYRKILYRPIFLMSKTERVEYLRCLEHIDSRRNEIINCVDLLIMSEISEDRNQLDADEISDLKEWLADRENILKKEIKEEYKKMFKIVNGMEPEGF